MHLQHLGYPIVNDPLYNSEYSLDKDQIRAKIHITNEEMEHIDNICATCKELHVPANHTDLWLHALKCSGKGFSFTTKLPEWAIYKHDVHYVQV